MKVKHVLILSILLFFVTYSDACDYQLMIFAAVVAITTARSIANQKKIGVAEVR